MKLLFAHFRSNTSLTFLLRLSVAAALMLLLVLSSGITPIMRVFQTVQYMPGVLVILCLIILFLMGAFNVWFILNAIHPLGFLPFLRAYAYSWAASLILPGQAGDATIIFFMKRYGVPLGLTGTSYLVDKFMTLLVFSIISWYGCARFLPQLEGLWFLLFFGTLISIPALFFVIRRLRVKATWWISLQKRIDALMEDIGRLRKKSYVLFFNFFLTILKWLLVSFTFNVAFWCFNTRVGWPDIALIPILSTLVGYIPISISGIGTVEFSATYLFGKVGISGSIVLSVYLFMRSLQYLLAGIFMLLSRKIDKIL